MARKNGCPMSVKNWQIDVLNPASTRVSPIWVRVKGVNSLTLSVDGDTEDGSDATALWSEPFVNKRSGSLNIEAKPITDAVTGAQDPGQGWLDYYATLGGCDGDCTLRLSDPYGHSTILVVVVTSNEKSADDTEMSRSWDTEIVGEPEEQTYVQVSGVTVAVDGGEASATASASVTVGGTKAATVTIAPENASNTKFSVVSADPSKVRVSNVDGMNFDITGIAATTSAVTVTVRTMNNSQTATVAVTVGSGT